MAVPDFQSLMRPLLEALPADGTDLSMQQARPKVATNLGLGSADLAEMLPGGRMSKFVNRLAFAKVYLGLALAVETTTAGRFRITERGKRLLSASDAPISLDTLKQFPEYVAWRRSQTASKGGKTETAPTDTPDTPDKTPDEQVEEALAAIDATLSAELLDRFRKASPAYFEKIVIDLLRAMGFTNGDDDRAIVTRQGGDGGIDGIIYQDGLELDAIYVQAKRYKEGNKIGRPDIQRFVGSMTGESASKGVFVTTSAFSREATDYLPRVQQRVTLVDGERLAELALRYGIGVRTVRTIEQKALDEGYFADDTPIEG